MKLEKYTEKFYVNPNNILSIENNYLTELLKEYIVPDSNCLDLGCGTGYWSEILCNLNVKVTGADISKEAIEKCKRNNPNITFTLCDELPDIIHYDYILVSWVLQEIHQDMDFIRLIEKASTMLKLSGMLIIVDNIYPDKRTLIRKSELGDIFSNNGEPKELRFFPEKSLTNTLKRFNLHSVKKELFGHSFVELFCFE